MASMDLRSRLKKIQRMAPWLVWTEQNQQTHVQDIYYQVCGSSYDKKFISCAYFESLS